MKADERIPDHSGEITRYFSGMVSDITFLDFALSPEEIKAVGHSVPQPVSHSSRD